MGLHRHHLTCVHHVFSLPRVKCTPSTSETAPTQFSMQRAASHLSRWAPLNWVTAAFFWGERLPSWALARSVFCSILNWSVPKLLCRAETPRSCREGEGG